VRHRREPHRAQLDGVLALRKVGAHDCPEDAEVVKQRFGTGYWNTEAASWTNCALASMQSGPLPSAGLPSAGWACTKTSSGDLNCLHVMAALMVSEADGIRRQTQHHARSHAC
jgi:hypothetical protein